MTLSAIASGDSCIWLWMQLIRTPGPRMPPHRQGSEKKSRPTRRWNSYPYRIQKSLLRPRHCQNLTAQKEATRQYNHEQLKRLYFVRWARELGFSLEEVCALPSMAGRTDFTWAGVHALTVDHLAAVQENITNLRKLEKVLSLMAAECSQGDVPDCPILDTF